jgi:hypothetical protein
MRAVVYTIVEESNNTRLPLFKQDKGKESKQKGVECVSRLKRFQEFVACDRFLLPKHAAGASSSSSGAARLNSLLQ